MRRKVNIWKHPYKWYVNRLKNEIEPTNPTHQITMRIDIPKGKTEGRALIPCSIYTLSHSIDLNPSLIRKKDGKILKHLSVNKKINYDSNKYDVRLTPEEKKLGYQLKELERCNHCGQKLVIAELAETRYRSCPDIKVRVADKAKENLTIPVTYGVRTGQIRSFLIFPLILDLILVYSVLTYVGAIPHSWLDGIFSNSISLLPKVLLWAIGLPIVLLCFVLVSHFYISTHYRAYRLYKWYSKVKPTLKCVKDKNWRNRG